MLQTRVAYDRLKVDRIPFFVLEKAKCFFFFIRAALKAEAEQSQTQTQRDLVEGLVWWGVDAATFRSCS